MELAGNVETTALKTAQKETNRSQGKLDLVTVLNLGDILLERGRISAAADCYRHSVKLDPTASQIWQKLAKALTKQEKWSEAAEVYSSAIDLTPEDFRLHDQLGETFTKLGEIEAAIGCHRRAIALNPDSFESYYQLGKSLYQRADILLEPLRANPNLGAAILKELQSKAPEIDIRQLNDEAFVQATSYLNEEDFVQESFRAYLKREPEPGTRDGAGAALRGGVTRLTLITNIRGSLEFDNRLKQESSCDEAIAFHWRGLEISHKYETEGFACYQRALEIETSSYELYYLLGRELTWRRRPVEGTTSHQKGLQLGITLLEKNHQNEAINCFQKALNFITEPINIYSELAIRLIDRGLLDRVLDCCHQASYLNPNTAQYYYHNISIHLATLGRIDEALVFFQKTPQIQNQLYEKIGKIWKGFNQIASFDEKDVDFQGEIKLEDARKFFDNTSRYKIIDLARSMPGNDKDFIEQVGISIANLELIQQDNWDLEKAFIKSFIDSVPKGFGKDVFNHLFYSYQQSLIETGYVYSVCPFTGRILRSNQSFVINHREVGQHDFQALIYRFEGKEIFYLMFGCQWGEKLLAYFPSVELIVNLNLPLLGFIESKDSINKLKSYMVSYWKQVTTYLKSENKKVVNIVGLEFNLGAYLGHALTGMELLSKRGLFPKIEKVLFGPGEYINVRDIFSELPAEKFIYVQNVESAFKTIVENNYVAFRAIGYFMEDNLMSKVYRASLKNCSPKFLDEVKEAKKKHFPLLVFQLRVHNRVWIYQREGLINIIKSLHSDFPNLGIVFDGWGRLEKEHHYVQEKNIELERATVEHICSQIPPEIEIYSSIGSINHEKVIWFHTCDTFLVPESSGLAWGVWVVNKPGVICIKPAGAEILKTLVSPARENYVDQTCVIANYVENNGNYDCDWKEIYEELVKIIRKVERKSE